ncbi:relaxase domain-containing protein [Luteococcus japonicus]|uniref:relaxase domain-containing protein n=1 Tax=Luteococcus japonicus TaxID=33984 RepID=UPI000B9A2C87
MSMQKLAAGTGYAYLTKQVARQDVAERGHVNLASYYSERGEVPGVWVGSGMAGIDGLATGDVVTPEQMRALFGAGCIRWPTSQPRGSRASNQPPSRSRAPESWASRFAGRRSRPSSAWWSTASMRQLGVAAWTEQTELCWWLRSVPRSPPRGSSRSMAGGRQSSSSRRTWLVS